MRPALEDRVATVLADRRTSEEIQRLADEQAALRRVATLVARGASEADVLAAIADGLGRLIGVDHARMWRFEGDTATAVASAGAFGSAMPVGLREPLHDHSLAGRVRRTWRSQRIDDYAETDGQVAESAVEIGVGSAVAVPIVVERRLWGAMVAAARRPRRLPADTEARMAQFTELMATAIANIESRARAERLAEEQAALRRVATLVAKDVATTELCGAVAAEVGTLLGADFSGIIRYQDEATVAPVATWAAVADHPPVPDRWHIEPGDPTTMIADTRLPARVDDWTDVPGAIAAYLRDELRVRSSVGCPIVVEGRLWGGLAVHSKRHEPLPADTESRLAQFTDLVAMAIANADSRDLLNASRARLLTAGDDARRQVVRDLHDGAQQHLVNSIATLKLAQRALRNGEGDPASLVDEALEYAARGNAEVRELAHGMLPSRLTRGGLRAGIGSLVARQPLPVEVAVGPERFPAELEASAYFIVAEALTNVVKHAHAERAEVRATVADGLLRIEVRDDGIGGADRQGHGLVGMSDRVTALGGTLAIHSPPRGGTTVVATLPLAGDR